MAIRQSVLALYDLADEALTQLNSTTPDSDTGVSIRSLASDVLLASGITGSIGERGWYGELIRYFDDHRITDTPTPVTAPTPDQIHADLTSGELLAPTWAARAIDAAFILDKISELGIRPRDNSTPFLAEVLAAAPAAGAAGERIDGQAQLLADRLNRAPIDSRQALRAELAAMRNVLSPAVATFDALAQLRKVKGEYCSILTTSATWSDIDYGRLSAAINPTNWPRYYNAFFCAMTDMGLNDEGWSRIHEEVSGDCGQYRLRTALKFWLGTRGNGLFMNYDIDHEDPLATDELVLVDNGYIAITPLNPADPAAGVSVRTSKELLISGMSATALTNFAVSLGWATNASDMFHDAVNYANPAQLAPFRNSTPGARQPVVDTSTTWPVVVPHIPGDLRQEDIKDAVDVADVLVDDATKLFDDFDQRWEHGINSADVNYLINEFGNDVTKDSKLIINKATGDFRPKPNPATP